MKTKVLIIGGGIPGLTLAGLLGSIGISCLVVEKSCPPAPQDIEHSTKTAALMQTSVTIIKNLGIWDDIAPYATPLKIMRLVDDSEKNREPVTIDFPACDIGLDAFGYNIPNMRLQDVILKSLSGHPCINILHEKSLQNFTVTNHHVSAQLDDGQEIISSLIVGADGRSSRTRGIAGIQIREHDCQQAAITCLISHTKTHHNISTEHHHSGGPFTLVPMAGDNSSVVWIDSCDNIQKLLTLPKDIFLSKLQERTHNALGKVSLASTPQSWPLKTLIANRLIAARTVIVAEAAHVMSPIAAQGLNLSMRDIATLAETIADAARLGQDIGAEQVLKKYQARRQIDMTTRTYGVDGLNRIVSNNLGFLKKLRKSALKTLETMPALKNCVMHQGLAPHFDEGRLMAGERL